MNKQGFSLIEIIVAVTIVALLSAATTVGVRAQRERSADVATIDQAVTIGNALDQYNTMNQDLTVTQGYVDERLQFLITDGLLSNMPLKLPNMVPGTTRTTNNSCYNYVVQAPAASSSTWNGITIGTRSWFIWLTTASVGDSANNNPLSARVYSVSSKNACGAKRAGSLIMGSVN